MSDLNKGVTRIKSKKQEIKSWAAIFIIGLISISAAGCSTVFNGQQPIDSPVKISYLIQNPLVVTTTEKTDVKEFYESKLSLAGFKDASIEKAINDSIKADYLEVKEGVLPPYRGIKKKIPAGSQLISNTVSANLSYNYNNVASITIYGYRNYVVPNQNGVIPKSEDQKAKFSEYTSVVKALNYDLNTGKEITLKDVFTNDVDYVKILNDYISNLIMKNPIQDENYYSMAFSGAELIAPFKGISKNQKFYLTQGCLTLILDQSNPEFDTGLYPATINIYFQELGDCVAITKRFYDEAKSPFVSTAPLIKEFMQSFSGQDIVKEKTSRIGNVLVHSSYRYPKQIPQNAENKILLLSKIDQNKISKLNAEYIDKGQGNSSFEQYVWATKAGPYTSVQRSIYIYSSRGSTSTTESVCYDQEGKALALSDLFIDGYDYEPILRKALGESLNQMNLKDRYSVDTLMKPIQFFLGNAEIDFYTDPVKADANSSYAIFCMVPFKDFGCQNMTIFKN